MADTDDRGPVPPASSEALVLVSPPTHSSRRRSGGPTGPTGGERPKKSDKTTIAQRVEEVLRLRLIGAMFHDIVQYGSHKGWSVSDRMIRKYIAKADALLVERLDKKRKQVIARHISQRQALFAQAVLNADYRTALAILDSEAKLRGLFPEKEMKELLRLLGIQATRIEELERRLASVGLNQETDEATCPPAGSARPEDSGPASGAA